MSTNIKVAAILLGAGSSSRMNGVDKIMMPLLGRPLLSYSLERLEQSSIVTALSLLRRSTTR